MERLHKRILLFLTVVGLGTIVNHITIPLIFKSEYIFGKIPLVTMIYLGGILWCIIAIKIVNVYIPDNDIEKNMMSSNYLEGLTSKNMLTNLPNTLALEKRFKNMKEKLDSMHFNILCIDVDGFKIVNDTMGYEAGDEILKRIADRLKTTVGNEGRLFHIRGDEFLLLIPRDESMENMKELSNRIIKAMAMSFVIKEKEVHLTVSVGIAGYPWGGSSVNLLLQNAHIAVQIAKESGKSNHKIYDDSMNIKMNRKLNLINNLHKALEKDEFMLYYQPQIESMTGDIVGLEALIRWNNSEIGLISPAEFIPLAEETGLIIPIGDWVLRTACKQNKKWQDAGYSPVPVSVNISTIQFQEVSFVDKVIDVLKETELDPTSLHLEITESIAIKDTEFTINTLDKLQEIGVKIALDDFGTGFSSLGYLNKFKINVLKIDSSFVRDIGEDDSTITKTIIVLGKSLNMEVIAEGVETNEQFNYLKGAGCDIIQGYLFSRPLPADQVEKMLDIA